MSTVYIQNPDPNHLRLTNDTGVALVQYEFLVIAGLAAVADEAIAIAGVGGFHVEEGLILQVSDLQTGEDTFATVDAPVYWDPATGKFSDTFGTTYYLVGAVSTIKDSNGVVLFTKYRSALLMSTTERDAFRTDITEIKSLSGIPFHRVITLLSASAGTAVDILTDAEVTAIGAAAVVYVTSLLLKVDGATAWTDSTGTIVTVQDTEASPVVGASYAKTQLVGNAILNLTDTGVTLTGPISTGVGFTAGAGIVAIADSDFDAGSNMKIMVSGYIY